MQTSVYINNLWIRNTKIHLKEMGDEGVDSSLGPVANTCEHGDKPLVP
jgi:hypothetical protein